MERISTGNPQLDTILHGGFPARSIHLIAGEPGTGKTILAEQLAFANLREDRPVLYLTTLSEPLDKFLTYLQEYTFADLSRIGTDILYETIGEQLVAAPETVPDLLLGLIQAHRPWLMIIDSFKAITDLLPDSHITRKALSAIAGIQTAYDMTSFWVGEYSGESPIIPPEYSIVDGILELSRRRYETAADRFLRVLKLRGSSFEAGPHAFWITGEGLQVFPRLVTPFTVPDYTPIQERVPAGVPGLDGLLETGLQRGSSSLVSGPPGSGKTVLGLHFLRAGVERGEAGLMVALQENPVQVRRTMTGFGWDTGSLLRPGGLDIFYTSPVELQIDTIVTEMAKRIRTHQVQRIVIDSINDLERPARSSMRFRDYMYTLYQFFAQQNLTTMFIMGSYGTFPSVAYDPNFIAHLNDNIFLLEFVIEADLVRTIRVVKSRGSGHDGRWHQFRISSRGVEVEGVVR